jgi:hypothetical protein
MNTISGTIVEIGDIQTWKRGFQTRHVVIDTGSSSQPNPIKIDCRDNDIRLLDEFKVNDMLEVLFNIQGRKWEGKYFTNIVAQNIRKMGEAIVAPKVVNAEITDDDIMGNSIVSNDDLPFSLFIPLIVTSLLQFLI